ncbi:MAG: cell division protein FtsZ, partial [Candidatus Cloacimonetes bacterium]|nr:cell division protein FtsZ [Candidatus Cloacimonadota bacterium]
KENVDTLIVVPNEKLRENTNNMTFLGAFEKANNILYKATKAIADIIHTTGHINVDFADIKTIIENRGLAMIGTGSGDGDERAKNAVNKAINNPLLEDISIQNAEGVLVNITAGKDFKMDEYDEITRLVVEKSGNAGDIIHGIVIDEKMEGKIKVTLIATGLEDPSNNKKIANDIDDITTEFGNFESKQNKNDDEMSRTLGIIKENENLQISQNLNRSLGNSDEQQLEVPAFLRSNNN